MELLLSAAKHFSRIADLPKSLRGAKQGETEDILLNLHAQIGERLVGYSHKVTDAKGSVADLVVSIQADNVITAALRDILGHS